MIRTGGRTALRSTAFDDPHRRPTPRRARASRPAASPFSVARIASRAYRSQSSAVQRDVTGSVEAPDKAIFAKEGEFRQYAAMVASRQGDTVVRDLSMCWFRQDLGAASNPRSARCRWRCAARFHP